MTDQKLIKRNKKRLLEEKTQLEHLLSRVAKRDSVGGDFRAKYPDLGNAEDENVAEVVEYETNIAEERDLEGKLRRVNGALSRIAEGTYGICVAGGEGMPVARLEAVPEAENCVQHESK